MASLRLIFFGTSAFGVPSLEILLRHNYTIAAVVTAPDKTQGRGQKVKPSPIKLVAAAHHLPILQPYNLKSPSFLEILRNYQANLQVVVAFRILPRVVWALPALGTFNLHASLLPQYRGAAPINWAIIRGEQETGVTTFFIEETIDTGHILFQSRVPIDEQDTAETLHERLKYQGAQLLLRTVQAIEQGSYTSYPQPFIPPNLLKQAPKLSKEDCQIDWEQDTIAILNFIRGLSPDPGSWTILQGSRVKILAARRVAEIQLNPGTIYSDGKHYLYIGTRNGAIAVEQLQLAGKKSMDIQTFLRGYQLVAATDL